MKRVTGIGGIFFKAQDPEKLKAWYQEHLGLELDSEVGGVAFKWREADQPRLAEPYGRRFRRTRNTSPQANRPS